MVPKAGLFGSCRAAHLQDTNTTELGKHPSPPTSAACAGLLQTHTQGERQGPVNSAGLAKADTNHCPRSPGLPWGTGAKAAGSASPAQHPEERVVLSLQNSRGRAEHLGHQSLPPMAPSRLLMAVQKGQGPTPRGAGDSHSQTPPPA